VLDCFGSFWIDGGCDDDLRSGMLVGQDIHFTDCYGFINLMALIRLRGEPITHSPKVAATVADSLQLARMVMAGLERRS
jgi:hypothetical protein